MKRLPFFITIFFALFLAITQSHAANSKAVTVTATGIAKTADKAVAHALAQAVQQTLGTDVSNAVYLQSAGSRQLVSWWNKQEIIDPEEINKGALVVVSRGPVKSYRVLDSQYLEKSGEWKVIIEAQVLKYQNQGEDRSHLLQLVVYPFQPAESTFTHFDTPRKASDASLQLLNELTAQFAETGKFRVLDRQHVAEASLEKLVASHTPAEAVKQGQSLGADFILTGELKRAEIRKQNKQLYGADLAFYQTDFNARYRVIEVATGEIRWAGEISLFLDHDALKQRLAALKTPGSAFDSQSRAETLLAEQLYHQFAANITRDVLDKIYPIKVLSADHPEQVYLSHGGSHLQPGDQFSLYTRGKMFTDPDTDITITTDGQSLGTITITAVNDTYAIGEYAGDRFSQVKAGTIARRTPAEKPAAPPAAAPGRPMTPGSSDKPVSW